MPVVGDVVHVNEVDLVVNEDAKCLLLCAPLSCGPLCRFLEASAERPSTDVAELLSRSCPGEEFPDGFSIRNALLLLILL